jgi:hypothetical protein
MLRTPIIALALFTGTFTVFAQEMKIAPVAWDPTIRIANLPEDPRRNFRTESALALPESTVPVVVEIPIDSPRIGEEGWNGNALIVDATGVVAPSYVKQSYTYTPTPYEVETSLGDGASLTDADTSTGVNFPLPIDTRQGTAVLTVFPVSMLRVSGITFSFERNAIPPATIEVRSRDAYGYESIVLSRTTLVGNSVRIMPTNSYGLTVYLEYNQPVKINEVSLTEESGVTRTELSVRFLAQPGMSYTLFSDPVTYTSLPYQDTTNLMSDIGVVRGSRVVTSANPYFVLPDFDNDGEPDMSDNCREVANPTQSDLNGNGIGDECDDYDRDGYVQSRDNCEFIANYDQRDTDDDGIGDECDTEESRFTERLPWVPWVGMGIAGFVLVGLFIFAAMDMRKKSDIQNGG